MTLLRITYNENIAPWLDWLAMCLRFTFMHARTHTHSMNALQFSFLEVGFYFQIHIANECLIPMQSHYLQALGTNTSVSNNDMEVAFFCIVQFDAM